MDTDTDLPAVDDAPAAAEPQPARAYVSASRDARARAVGIARRLRAAARLAVTLCDFYLDHALDLADADLDDAYNIGRYHRLEFDADDQAANAAT